MDLDMASVEKIIAQIDELSADQRLRLWSSLQRESALETSTRAHSVEFPSIVKTSGVCGGAACLIRTRIPVLVLERMRQLGIADSAILENFPSLSPVDLAQAWSYVAKNQAEIEQEINENEGE